MSDPSSGPSDPSSAHLRRVPRTLVAVLALVVLAVPQSGAAEPTVPGTATLAAFPLGSTSAASLQRCETWPDIGTEQWRATWSAKDAGTTANADGVSATIRLKIVKAPWMVRIDRLIGSRRVGVAVGSNGHLLYQHDGSARHVPASNEKLLLSMALLSRLPPTATIVTRAEAASLTDRGVIPDDLWLVGRGDPTIGRDRMQRPGAGPVHARVRGSRGAI